MLRRLALAAVLWLVAATPLLAQNASNFQAALTNTQVNVKAAPGVFDAALCFNTNAAVTYVQVFDSAVAVTVGTTAPSFVVPLTASTVTNVLGLSRRMINGIRIAATTTATGATAPGAPVVCTVFVK
jgi:hypothetical protein